MIAHGNAQGGARAQDPQAGNLEIIVVPVRAFDQPQAITPMKGETIEKHQLNNNRAFIEPLLPELPKRPDDRGRPWRDSREVLNGILWILRTGAQWSEMPNWWGRGHDLYKRIFLRYVDFYNDARTHLSLVKDAPARRALQPAEKGRVVELKQVCGLQHLYTRMAS